MKQSTKTTVVFLGTIYVDRIDLIDLEGTGWLNEYRSLDVTAHTSLSPIRHGFTPIIVNYKKGALGSQPQVIKFTSCLPMAGGSLRVLQLPPPLKLLAMT